MDNKNGELGQEKHRTGSLNKAHSYDRLKFIVASAACDCFQINLQYKIEQVQKLEIITNINNTGFWFFICVIFIPDNCTKP